MAFSIAEFQTPTTNNKDYIAFYVSFQLKPKKKKKIILFILCMESYGVDALICSLTNRHQFPVTMRAPFCNILLAGY